MNVLNIHVHIILCTCLHNNVLLLSVCREYATDVNVFVARKAIQAIGKIALRVSARANTCADKLVSLLSMEIDYVTAETLVSLASKTSTIKMIQMFTTLTDL